MMVIRMLVVAATQTAAQAEAGATCGDGSLCPELEFCDDGNTDVCDGCHGDCSRADNVCGDSILECAETCDDGNARRRQWLFSRLSARRCLR